MAPNKTLAAQLAAELREFLPDNAVVYFVQLLRLLPARGVRPVDGHLHREGLLDQRGGREAAPRGDRGAALAQGRRRGRVRLGCIYGIGSPEDYAGTAVFLRARASSATATSSSARSSTSSTTATTTSSSRGTFRVRGDVLDIFPPYADHPLRVELLRRRDRERSTRSTSSPARCSTAFDTLPDLAGDALRDDARRSCRWRSQAIRDELRERLRAAQGRGQAARGAAARDAHELRPRDARGDGLLHRHRELLAAPRRPGARASRRTASSTTSATTSCA